MQPSPLLVIARGCCCTAKAGLSGQDKDCVAHKAEHTDCLASYRKRLLTPAWKCASELAHPGGKETGVSIPTLSSLQG